jgi:hypothetical protein
MLGARGSHQTVNTKLPKKTRVSIPSSVREAVLREFNHRCAICGADRPQLHHIDENPENNDPGNLLPTCPNCHLTDQHNPTVPADPEKLALFRRYKDPAILAPQFEPLFARLKFLAGITDSNDSAELQDKVAELTAFIYHLEMGEFYAQVISQLLKAPSRGRAFVLGGPLDSHEEEEDREFDSEYRQQLRSARSEVYRLVVELLRYQMWGGPSPSAGLSADNSRRR